MHDAKVFEFKMPLKDACILYSDLRDYVSRDDDLFLSVLRDEEKTVFISQSVNTQCMSFEIE